MRNRKWLSLICAVLAAVMLFGACTNKTPDPAATDPANPSVPDNTAELSIDERLIGEIYRDGKEFPYVYLTADKTKVSAGDSIEVHIMLANSENLAAFDVDVDIDESVYELTEYYDGNIKGLTIMSDCQNGLYRCYGITATTQDVEDGDAGTLILKIKDGTPKGELVLSGVVKQYLIGTDDSGDTVADLARVKDMSADLRITVTG